MDLTTKPPLYPHYTTKTDFYIGVALAVSSSLFIGSSFIIKKISLLRLSKKGALRAGAGGFGYLHDWLWWLGLATMGIGELANFTAYAFAPASLVTPLGALSVLVSALLASECLKEKLNLIGKLSCLLCIVGSTLIVLHAPKEEQVQTLDELMLKLRNPAFVNYVLIVIGITFCIIFYAGPRYGNRFVTVYITLCSAIGSLTVMACKALGLAIKETLSESSPISNQTTFNWTVCVLVLVVVFCVFMQMNYLNKALDLFSTNVVTPIYYVMFTTLVIVASAILFKEWGKMSIEDITGSVCGFIVVVIAIYLLNAFKEVDQHKTSLPLLRPVKEKDYGARSII